MIIIIIYNRRCHQMIGSCNFDYSHDFVWLSANSFYNNIIFHPNANMLRINDLLPDAICSTCMQACIYAYIHTHTHWGTMSKICNHVSKFCPFICSTFLGPCNFNCDAFLALKRKQGLIYSVIHTLIDVCKHFECTAESVIMVNTHRKYETWESKRRAFVP